MLWVPCFEKNEPGSLRHGCLDNLEKVVSESWDWNILDGTSWSQTGKRMENRLEKGRCTW